MQTKVMLMNAQSEIWMYLTWIMLPLDYLRSQARLPTETRPVGQ